MRYIQSKIHDLLKETQKVEVSENQLVAPAPRVSTHAGPGYYLYDIRSKQVSPTPVHSIADSVKAALEKLTTSGDFEFFYFNCIVYKDDSDLYSLVQLNNSMIGPFPLEALHNKACEICSTAYTQMAQRAASLKTRGTDNTIQGHGYDPTQGLPMEGAKPKKKVIADTKKSRKPLPPKSKTKSEN